MRIVAPTTDWLMKNHCPSAPSSHSRVKDLLSLLKWKKVIRVEKALEMPLLSHPASHTQRAAELRLFYRDIDTAYQEKLAKPFKDFKISHSGALAEAATCTAGAKRSASFSLLSLCQALLQPLRNIRYLRNRLQKTGSANATHFCLPLA